MSRPPQPIPPPPSPPPQTRRSSPSPLPPSPPPNPALTSVSPASSDDSNEDDGPFAVLDPLPAELDLEEWEELVASGRMLKWSEAQKKANQQQVRISALLILSASSSVQCDLCRQSNHYCVNQTDSVNGKCILCIKRRQACSLARNAARGRPPLRHPSSSGPRKRKQPAAPVLSPAPKKRVRLIPPRQNQEDFNAALSIIAILRDAFAAADAEVRRQMARGADAPSLQDLLAILLPSAKPDTKGKGKER